METWLTRRSSDARAIATSLSHPERFAAIFDRHYDAIHAYLARRAGAALADDLAATTFTVAFERRATFRAESTSARPWLYGIATNLLRDQWRADERASEIVARLRRDAAGASGGAHAGVAEIDDQLAAALSTIDPEQLTVLLLVAWEGLSYAEIGEALGVPVGTVRSRLSRARAQLSARLGRGSGAATEAIGAIEEQESCR